MLTGELDANKIIFKIDGKPVAYSTIYHAQDMLEALQAVAESHRDKGKGCKLSAVKLYEINRLIAQAKGE